MKRYVTCMTIAGSDPSGGAGIQADLKTFSALGCYGQAAVTTLTVQNTKGVSKSVNVDAQFVAEQVDAVWADWLPDAVKIGITGTADIVMAISKLLNTYRPKFVVLDPVMISSSGHRLMDASAESALLTKLMPLCSLITPNIPEAKALLNLPSADTTAPSALATQLSYVLGDTPVLVKGGHADGAPIDFLHCSEGDFAYTSPRIVSPNTHGTGCTLSSAIAAFAARGLSLPQAVASAKNFLTQALSHGADIHTGHGTGPLCHFFNPEKAIVKENK